MDNLECLLLIFIYTQTITRRVDINIFSNIFPIFNIVILVVINIPPYEIADNIYESTIGALYRQNKKVIESFQKKIRKIFDQNT